MIHVRLATPADVPEMSRVLIASITELCRIDHRGNPEAIATWTANKTQAGVQNMLEAPQTRLLVAERDGIVVGTTTITPPGSEFREIGLDDEVEFRFLAVAPEAWRTGVGDALVAACEQHARETGATALAICAHNSPGP